MDWVKIHLAVNHVSVIGTPFLTLLLAWGWARRTDAITRLAVWWIAIFSIVSIALKFTGDFAAEQAASRFDSARAHVNAHEQAADQATSAVFVSGLAAAVSLFLGRRGRKIPNWSLATTLILTLLTCALLARTANLGGQISHPELRRTSSENRRAHASRVQRWASSPAAIGPRFIPHHFFEMRRASSMPSESHCSQLLPSVLCRAAKFA